MPFPILFAASTLANMAHSLYSENQAKKGLRSLVKPQGYNVTPEQANSYSSAQQAAKGGYSGAEKAAFQNNLSTQNNTSYNKAMTYGGNSLAGAIQSGINYGNNRALTDFAAKDAAQHRANIRYADSRGDVISGQRNRQAGLENQRYDRAVAAYGGAIKTQKENFWGSMNLFAASNPYLKMLGIGGGGPSGAGAIGGGAEETALGDNGGGDGGYMEGDAYSGAPMAGFGENPSYTGNVWNSGSAYGASAPNYGMKGFPPMAR